MSQIEIRRASKQLGNIGGVRMVDTSAMADSGWAAVGKAAENLGNIPGQLFRAGTAAINILEAEDKRVANKTALEVMSIYDSVAYAAGTERINLDGTKTVDGRGFFRQISESDEAARGAIDSYNNTMNDAYEAAGVNELTERQQALVREALAAYERNALNRVNEAVNKRWEYSRQSTSEAMLERARQQVSDSPDALNAQELERAFTDWAQSHYLTDEVASAKWDEMKQLTYAAAVEQRMNGLSPEEADTLIEEVRSGHTPRYLEGISSFGENLSVERREALVKGLEQVKAKALVERDKVRGEEIDNLALSQSEGKATYDGLLEKREEMAAQGYSAAQLKKVDKIINDQVSYDVAYAIRGLTDGALTDPNGNVVDFETFQASLPPHVVDSDAWRKIRAAHDEENLEERVAQFGERVKLENDALAMGYDPDTYARTDLGYSERLSEAFNRRNRGLMTAKEYKETVDAINATNDAQVGAEIRQVLQDFNFVREELGFTEKEVPTGLSYNMASAVDISLDNPTEPSIKRDGFGQTISRFYNHDKSDRKINSELLSQAVQRFDESFRVIAKGLAENPTWSGDEKRAFIREVLKYPFAALANAKFVLPADQLDNFRNALGAAHAAGIPISGNLDYDAASVIGAVKGKPVQSIFAAAPGDLQEHWKANGLDAESMRQKADNSRTR